MWKAALLVLLVPAASAAPLDLFAASDGQSLFLTRDADDPRHTQASDDGSATTDTMTWALRLSPERNATWSLNGSIVMAIRLGAATGAGAVDVTSTLEATKRPLATAPAKQITYAGDFASASWTLPVETTLRLEDGPLWWNITARGTYSNLFLDMDGADRTRVTLPVTNMTVPVPPVPVEQRNVTGDRLLVKWEPDTPLTRHVSYDWTGAPANATGHVRVTPTNGSVVATLLDNGTAIWQGQWPPAANGTIDLHNLTGALRLQLEFDAFTGAWELLLEEPEPPQEPPKSKPSPAPLMLLALLVAVRRYSG